MGGLLYFAAERRGRPTLDDLAAWGLGYAFDRQPTPCECRPGPGGGAGLVLADDRQVSRIGYFPDGQQWRRIPRTANYVGFVTEDPPAPESLAKPTLVPGHRVRLRDGNDWMIPVARGTASQDGGLVGCMALPTATDVDEETGEWRRGQVVPEHRDLWGMAQAWWDVLLPAIATSAKARETGDPDPKIKLDFEIPDVALAALATNYRVSAIEVALLGLFDETVEQAIANALVDWPTWLAFWEKKTAGLAVAT